MAADLPPVDGRASRLYRILLRGYPRSFRDRHGEEMVRLFLERLRDARSRGSMAGLALLWAATIRDVVANAAAERRAEKLHRRAAHGGAGDEGPGPGPGTSGGRRRGGGGMDGLVKDLQYALRTLVRSPGFAAVAVLTIALGIGANTAIFSVVRAVLLRPLPYPEPHRLVAVWGAMTERGVTDFPFSPPDFRDLRERARTFEGLGAVVVFPLPLTGDGEPDQVQVAGASHDFLDVLGVAPALGRGFTVEDGAPAGPDEQLPGGFSPPRVAILSHHLWRQRFGGDPGVLGRTVEIGGNPTTVVGVLPAGFRLLLPPSSSAPERPDIWVANRFDFDAAPRGNVFLNVVGRLRQGATLGEARADADAVAGHLRSVFEGWASAGFAIEVTPLHEDLVAGVRPVVLALFGAVVFVLLVACANVSNLLLVRAAARERELAVRAALGGSRRRIVRQLLAESGVLAVAGAALGVGLAWGGIRLLVALRPQDLPRIDTVAIDGPVLVFTAGAALVAALVFGTLPALQGAGVQLADALKDRGSAGTGVARRLLRNGVVAAEVALSLVLLIGAGLMVRSFVTLQRVDPGYDPASVLTFTTNLPGARYEEPVHRHLWQRELRARLAALPGVSAVGAGFPLPLSGQAMNGRYGTEEALQDPSLYRQADYRVVLPGYFEALGSRLLAGRTFTDADEADSAAVVVVDARLAARTWLGQDPVGKRFLVRVIGPEPEWVEVVGVVEHQRSASLAEEGRETVYFTDRWVGSFGFQTWALRTSLAPLSLAEAVRAEVRAMDPQVPVANLRPMDAYVRAAMAPTRFALVLIGVFAGVAVVLAAVGLYGVLSYAVRQRTAEIGVRMAFGAESGSIARLVVGQGLAVTLVGMTAGVLAALGLTRAMEALLVGVAPTDPATFAAISVAFLAVAAAACYLPARRAARLDPASALRE